MGFAVLHSEKGKQGASSIGKHIDRDKKAEHTFEHADKQAKVFDFTQTKFKDLNLQEAIDLRIADGYKGKTEIRKDAVKFVTHVLTGSHEDMKRIFSNNENANAWIKDNYNFMQKEFGAENIVKFKLHLDEKTPHLHVVTVPLTEDGRLSAKERFGDRTVLSARQDRYAAAMSNYDLERGIKHTGIKHETAKEYYGRVQVIENEKDKLQSKIEEKINEFSISAIDVALGKTEQRKNEFKEVLNEFVNKELQNIGKSLIAQNTQLKKQIRDNSKGLDNLNLSHQAKTIKDDISVLEYLSAKCKSGELVFEGKRGVELYFAYPGQKTGSISVNTQKNLFYDHQTGKGGDVIRACEVVENRTFKEVLNELSKGVDKSAVSIYNQKSIDTEDENKQKTTITAVFDDIKHPALLKYAEKRGISIKSSFLKEVHYERDGKNYFALGWKNNSGGFDLRNENFKGKLGKNDITSLKVGNPNILSDNHAQLLIYEGFSDYLAHRKNMKETHNFQAIILNSTSNIDKCIDEIKKQTIEDISVYFDRDAAGDKATQKIVDSVSCDVYDQREHYLENAKDLNEHFKLKSESEQNQKLRGKDNERGMQM